MRRLKYIRVQNTALSTVEDNFIIFPYLIGHNNIKNNLNHTDRVLSAGFVHITTDQHGNPLFECYGKSVSLGIESDPNDSHLLNSQCFDHYGV